MTIVDADKFLSYLIFSKHIDGLTCGEVKEAIEMCKVDVFDKIKEEIEEAKTVKVTTDDTMIEVSADVVINPQYRNFTSGLDMAIDIINRY